MADGDIFSQSDDLNFTVFTALPPSNGVTFNYLVPSGGNELLIWRLQLNSVLPVGVTITEARISGQCDISFGYRST